MNISHKQSAFIQTLKALTETREDSLEKAVALEAYDPESDEYTLNFFENLLNHGCVSGMVSSLVFYNQTEAFFDKYYEDIIWLKEEYEESIGQPMKIPLQLKNHLAWFAFEQTAYQMVNEAGLEI